MSLENSIDTIGNRNSDLPAFSAVPQLTAPPREEYLRVSFNIYKIQFVYRIQICNFNFTNFQGSYYFL